MILVTTGMLHLGFDRLIKGVDELKGKGLIEDEVFFQTGYSKYKPKHGSYETIIPIDKMGQLLSKCDVLITHGGAGLIVDGLERNKPVIAVPRRKKYHEHVNDHQLELLDILEKDGRIIAVQEIENLPQAIKEAKKMKVRFRPSISNIPELIEDFLASIRK